jgi:pimeloyl-ACP methyl ester carboxylesterase
LFRCTRSFEHWYAWRQLIPPLAARHRVICPDMRGCGWSQAPAKGYEKERLSRDVLGARVGVHRPAANPGANPSRPNPLPGPYRALLAAQAAVLVAFGAALFVAPDVGEAWPWELTDLTGRAIAAWLIAVGGLLAAIWWENERSRIRLGVYLLLALVPLQAIALARFGDAVDWSGAAAFVVIAFMATVLAAGAWGLRISRQSGRRAAA